MNNVTEYPQALRPETSHDAGDVQVHAASLAVGAQVEALLEPPRGEELYAAFPDLQFLPPMAVLPDGTPTVTLAIQSDRKIMFAGVEFTATDVSRFLLGTLLLRRDCETGTQDFRDFGLRPVAPSALTLAMARLLTALEAAAGHPVIQRQRRGKNSFWSFCCNVEVSDERVHDAEPIASELTTLAATAIAATRQAESQAEHQDDDNPREKYGPEPLKRFEPQSTIVYDPAQRVTTLMTRDAAITAINVAYGKHPTAENATHPIVEKALRLFMTEGSLPDLGRPDDDLRRYRLLDGEDWPTLFLAIEKGLMVYKQLGGLERPDQMERSSAQQELALVELVAAYNILAVTNRRLVASREWRFRFGLLSPEDIIQEGNIGLGNAIKRYDVSRKEEFSTYAVHWIDQAIRRAIAKKSRTISIPEYQHDNWLILGKHYKSLCQELDRKPEMDEIMARTGFTAEEIDELLKVGQPWLVSLDQRPDDDDAVVDFIFDAKSDPRQAQSRIEDRLTLDWMVARAGLTYRQEVVLSLLSGVYFDSLRGKKGLIRDAVRLAYDDVAPSPSTDNALTVKEVAALMGLSTKTIANDRDSALGLLRANEA